MLTYFDKREMYYNSFKTGLAQLLNKKKSKKWFQQFYTLFKDKVGLEIGGPSALFSGDVLPVYELSAVIDGCNFSNTTVWEGNIVTNDYNYYKNKQGKQFIAEGSYLPQITDEQYDFLLSCHNLEHIANPIKAVKEWNRILKKGGVMVLVLPDKRFTFDKKRSYTSFAHLLQDFKDDMGENDTTHIPEVQQFHYIKLDPGSGNDMDKFKLRCEQNFQNRCMHHHVFSQDALQQIFAYLNIEVVSQKFVPSIHQIIIGKKR